jgi:glycosyltransferase involved in cell wall biosynthesis
MNILILVHEFPPVGGGGGHVAKDLGEGLAEIGHEIKIITADLLGGVQETSEFQFSNLDLIRVPTVRKKKEKASLIAMASFNLSSIIHCIKLFKSWKPDVIHAHFAVPAGPIAWILSKIYRIPYVLTIHLGDVPGGTPEKTRKWFRVIKPFTYPIWNQAQKVVAVSEFTRQLALRHYQGPIDVIFNGVDLSFFSDREMVIHQPPRIIFAGRFVPQKNPLLITQILAPLIDREWELVMLGDGPQFEDVKREVDRLDLKNRVKLPGWVNPDEVRRELMKSDILFMPSFSEGLPVVGVQALAAGLAFVVSDIGGFVDLVETEKNGYRLPMENTNVQALFAEKLAFLLDNQNVTLAYKQYSVEKSMEFNIHKITQRYDHLLIQVIDEYKN